MAEVSTAAQGSRISPEAHADGPLVGVARSVEAAAHRVKEKVVETKDKMADKSLGDFVNDGQELVREHPGTTILISVGVGALVGYLIGRRRS